jgi:thiosulfate reductase/polysulfide reductase chain A
MGAKGGGKWKQISWEEATDEIAERLIQVKEKHGPESFVLSVGALGVLAGLDHDIGKFLHLFGSPNRLVDLNI